MTSQYQPGFSPLLRLAPLHISEIPPHPDLPLSDPKQKLKPQEDYADQPDLLPFITTLLNDGLAFLSQPELSANFHKSSTKKADGSTANVDILSRSISKSAIARHVPWYDAFGQSEESSRRPSATPATAATTTTTTTKNTSPDPVANRNNNTLSVPVSQGPRSRSASVASTSTRPKIRRHKPTTLQDEHWFTRRSVHASRSSKLQPGTASWEQFLFGLLSSHSKHEQEFTPSLFDAQPVVNWDGQVRKLAEEGGLRRQGWQDVQASVWEMCHELPGVLGPRCFGVLVVGGRVIPTTKGGHGDGGEASSSATTAAAAAASSSASSPPPPQTRWANGETAKFVVVTVPVQLQGVKASFYGSGRNFKEPATATAQQKRAVVQGLYAAVEVCTLRNKARTTTDATSPAAVGHDEQQQQQHHHHHHQEQKTAQAEEAKGEDEEEVEWIMSTASDAMGNLPMWMQKMAMPGQLPKDVSYFMRWIRDVDEERVEEALAALG